MPTLQRSAPVCRALLAISLLATSTLHAQRREYRFELGAGGALTSFAGVTDLESGFGGALWLGYWFPNNLSIEVEGTSASAQTAAGSTTDVLSVTGSLLYNFRAGESSSLFLKAGFGTSRYGDSCPAVSVPGSGPCGSASAVVLGGGFRAAFSPAVMLRGGIDYQRNSDETAFGNIVATLGLSFLPGSRPLVDSDQDRVFDRKDKCPGTPVGAIVNKQGCPSDTDGDAVPDGLDRCPGTPTGATVNDIGCPSDTDKDGVVDGVDQCGETPAGSLVDATGCPTDGDKDGVADGLDRCPETPAGATVDALGCPSDGDNDGVPDGVDQCAKSPPGSPVNAVGCPPAPEEAARGVGPWTVPGTAFAPLSSTIGVAGLPVLDSLVALLRAYRGTYLDVVGHAGEAQTQAANLQLAADRADAVRNYLLRSGVRPDQLQASGEAVQGVAPSAAAALPENRRVDIRLIAPPAP